MIIFMELIYGLFVLMMLMRMSSTVAAVDGVGINWGVQSTHPLLAPWTTVRLLKENGIRKVKLLDADTLKAISNSGIEVMVGIPNDMLPGLANSVEAGRRWVSRNVSKHVSNSVNIRHVAVGNEQFLGRLSGTYVGVTLPALRNLRWALEKEGLSNSVKVTVPVNAEIYEAASNLPSDGNFRADIMDAILKIVGFLMAGPDFLVAGQKKFWNPSF